MTARNPPSAAAALEMFDFLFGPKPGVKIDREHGPVVSYRTEADMRRGLAKLAFAYGWNVQEEVVIPVWGRIDLVLRDTAPGSILIELKRSLAKPSEVRRGFQQADGYGRWWTTNRGEPAQVILSAGSATVDIAPVATAYPEVRFLLLGQVMAGLSVWGNPRERIGVAQARADELCGLLEVHDHAVKKLDGSR